MSSTTLSTNDSSFNSDSDDEEDFLTTDEDLSPQLLTTRYRLWLHAVNLPRQGGLRGRLPTTYAVVTTQQPGTVNDASHGAGGTLGETETIAHNNHPQWTESFVLEYEAGTKHFFFVHVFVKHNRPSMNSLKEKEETLLGSARFEVGDVLSTHQHTRARRLRSGGCVFCRLEPPKTHLRSSINSLGTQQQDVSGPLEPVAYLRFRLAAKNLHMPHRKRRSFSKLFHDNQPDTFVTIAKKPEKESRHMWAMVFRSQPVGNSLNPKWDLSLVEMDTMGGGRTQDPLDQFIRISVFAVGKPPRLLGFCETTLRIFLQASLYNSNHSSSNANNNTQPDIPSDRTIEEAGEASEFILQRNHRKMKEVGKIIVLEASIVTMDEASGAFQKVVLEEQQEQDDDIPISVDLAAIPVLKPPQQQQQQQQQSPENIRNLLVDDGCKINFCVAIDFTSSNGDPRNDQSSLHYQSESFNDYEESILAVGNAVQQYSESNEYNVWGFGAKFDRKESQAHHIFQCGPKPVVKGVDGILDAYKSMFQSTFIMSGPTVFLNVLQASAVQAKRQHDQMSRGRPKYTVLLIITDGIMATFDETLRKLRVYQQVPLSIIFVGVGRSDFADLNNLCQACPDNTTFVEFRQQQTPSAFAHAALSQLPRQMSSYMTNRFGR